MRAIASEAWLALFMLVVLVIFPIFVGIGLVRFYRLFNPREDSEATSIVDIGDKQSDPFWINVVIGWVLCAPIYYLLYTFIGPLISLSS